MTPSLVSIRVGSRADPIVVADELQRPGNLERWVAPYLASLIATVPTAANTAYYARIVRERATMRRLVEAGTRVTQLGYAADGGDVDELVNLAQAEIYAVSERNSSDDYVRVGDILDDANLEIEAAQNRDNKGMRGVPTGFIELDELTGGLQAGQMVIIAGRPAMGKSTLALDICRSAAIRHKIAACYFSLGNGTHGNHDAHVVGGV